LHNTHFILPSVSENHPSALAPIVGYEQAAALAKEASASGRTIGEVARERSGIPSAELERLLDPRSQT
jgi:fumarate hydratase class II